MYNYRKNSSAGACEMTIPLCLCYGTVKKEVKYMKKVTAMEMRNVEGGAKCPGCGKKCAWGTSWFHKLFCWKYQASKVKFPGL